MEARSTEEIWIAAGTSEDIDGVMLVMEAAFGDRFGEAWTRSQLAGILPMGGVTLMTARDTTTETMVGFSLTRTIADESELLLIGVLPHFHRHGIGRRLLEVFLSDAATSGVSRAHLEVRDGNPAIAMYRALGFEPVGRRRKYYRAPDGERYDAITLAREL